MAIIHFYNFINLILFPIYFLVSLIRVIRKKDTLNSIAQRIGCCMKKRPEGDVIWMHAASVGESMLVLTLIEEFNKLHPEKNYLITTGTLSSSEILEAKLPENAMHQFIPMDNLLVVRKFIHNWRPNIGIFIESELWPCLIIESAKKFDLILINARLSDKSYARWQKYKNLFHHVINNFKSVMVQSEIDLKKYQSLGCDHAVNLGNLKFANKKLDVDQDKLQELKRVFVDRKVFVAASTHYEDEEVILEIIKDFKQLNVNYYPIIILRHPERYQEVARQCTKLGLSYSIRSSGKLPSLEDDLYIVDSFGELGLFYNIAFISFVGGSFAQGGHNLLEPAYFNNVIIFGPDMSNFQNITDDMIDCKAALQVGNAKELAEKIKFYCDESHYKEALEIAQNASSFVENRGDTLTKYVKTIETFIK